MAFDVLEHIEDDISAISEIHRVLKNGGAFVFTVPAFNFLYSSHDRALNHFRRYDKRMLRERLSDFSCMETGFWVFSLFLPVAAQRLLKRRKSEPEVHYTPLPRFLNETFYNLLRAENWLIKRGIPLPVGTTIYGIYKKPVSEFNLNVNVLFSVSGKTFFLSKLQQWSNLLFPLQV